MRMRIDHSVQESFGTKNKGIRPAKWVEVLLKHLILTGVYILNLCSGLGVHPMIKFEAHLHSYMGKHYKHLTRPNKV